jgi:hypothetical protein
MISRELVIAALNHQPVNRVPRDLWVSPRAKLSWREEVAEVAVRYPSDIIRPNFHYSRGEREKGKSSSTGRYTDAWGCTWEVAPGGAGREVRNPPLADGGRVAEYEPPLDIFKAARFGPVSRDCEKTTRFVLAKTETSLFRRLCLLRGSKAACADLVADRARIRKLLAKLHDFSCQEMEHWADTEVDGVELSEDLGTSDLGPDDSLPIGSQMWREIFKPLLAEYCKILRGKDKFVFLSVRGDVSGVLTDLVKVGVDAVHLQPFPTDFQKLAKRLNGRLTLWAEVDHEVISRGSADDIADAVRLIRRPLDFGSGGLIARCRWQRDVPPGNVLSLFENWMQPLPMHK